MHLNNKQMTKTHKNFPACKELLVMFSGFVDEAASFVV